MMSFCLSFSKRNTVVLLMIMVFSAPGYAHAQTDSLGIVVNKIAKYNAYETGLVGEHSDRTELPDEVLYLKEKANDSSLIQLCEYENPVVRAYAFVFLAERKPDTLLPIVKKHLTDTTSFKLYAGCIGHHTSVADFMLRISEKVLVKEEMRILDSLILSEANLSPSRKRTLLEQPGLSDTFYPAIREFYFKTEEKKFRWSSLLALASYCKTQDVEIISSWLRKDDARDRHYGFKAAALCPSSKFRNTLQEHTNTELTAQKHIKPYVKALVSALNAYTGDKKMNKLADELSLFPD